MNPKSHFYPIHRDWDQFWSHLAKNVNSSESDETSRWQHYEWDWSGRTNGLLFGIWSHIVAGMLKWQHKGYNMEIFNLPQAFPSSFKYFSCILCISFTTPWKSEEIILLYFCRKVTACLRLFLSEKIIDTMPMLFTITSKFLNINCVKQVLTWFALPF